MFQTTPYWIYVLSVYDHSGQDFWQDVQDTVLLLQGREGVIGNSCLSMSLELVLQHAATVTCIWWLTQHNGGFVIYRSGSLDKTTIPIMPWYHLELTTQVSVRSAICSSPSKSNRAGWGAKGCSWPIISECELCMLKYAVYVSWRI